MTTNGKVISDSRIDVRIAQYLVVREEIRTLEARHKEELAPLQAFKEQLAGIMMAFLDATKQESARTKLGTIFTKTNHYASLADPEAFMEFVIANEQFELMDRKANSLACRDYAKEHGTLPPEVRINSVRNVNVKSQPWALVVKQGADE